MSALSLPTPITIKTEHEIYIFSVAPTKEGEKYEIVATRTFKGIKNWVVTFKEIQFYDVHSKDNYFLEPRSLKEISEGMKMISTNRNLFRFNPSMKLLQITQKV